MANISPMSRYFRAAITSMSGYVPGEQPRDNGIIKLNTNENPYPPSPRVLAAMKKAMNASLRLYPDPLADGLRSLAASVYGVHKDNILAGNGSDELLSILMRCFAGVGDRVAFPVPSYSLYDTLVAVQDATRVAVDYPPDFSMPEALSSQNAALTFLCNPNSPSGTLVPLHDVERLARAVSGILVVDEAYIDFAETEGASTLPLIRTLPNVVVLRSFSKSFSLAGMRIGLAFAPAEIISGMMKVKDSYNLNRLSLAAAMAALQDMTSMKRNVRRIQRNRKKLTAALRRLGYFVHPSHANFVMAQKKGENLRPVYEALKQKNILVRYFDVAGLQDCLRITVGTAEEIKRLLEVIPNDRPPWRGVTAHAPNAGGQP
ncbi:MAG TPA: histidinol-phosphate transaminase [Candidatus Binatia bacterium]|nr:histidinol-phosphate transaminase [Candidatus Binatia bacterium]